MIEKRHINRAAPEVVQIIRSLKPYKGGNEALRAIHDLDIFDKHKTIIPCLGITDIPDLELFFNGESLVSFENCRVSAKDGMQIFNFPPRKISRSAIISMRPLIYFSAMDNPLRVSRLPHRFINSPSL